MNFRFSIIPALLLLSTAVFATTNFSSTDSLVNHSGEVINTDSILNMVAIRHESAKKNNTPQKTATIHQGATGSNNQLSPGKEMILNPDSLKPIKIDTLLLRGNPFFIDLVFMGYPHKFEWDSVPDYLTLLHGTKATTLTTGCYTPVKVPSTDDIIAGLRSNARDEITRKAADLYIMTYDQLPDPNQYRSKFIKENPDADVKFVSSKHFRNKAKTIYFKKEQLGPWVHNASALAQFSENTVTANWYQGGNNNVAVLGILSGQLNYDNKKNIQWENSAEWRLGFNTVPGDTLRMMSTSDDVLKINSKLGVKASGSFFYSASFDFSTQFFNSYNGVNSNVLKTSFLTPVRMNLGVGMDYKYKKIFSLMVSPFSYKYIYANNPQVNPNLFGIVNGGNHLAEVGSSLTAQLSYPVSHEIQLDSKFSFFTNYQKMEVDWEVVCNMQINRFMSTRISLHPRYDNSVILPSGQRAALQFKQLISVGFSHKFW